tara:strand:- start:1771 stop:2136 length:366 start_codon:yes stop_codon:yes gene_type:complete
MRKVILGLLLLVGTQMFAQGRMSEASLKKMQDEEMAALSLTEQQMPQYKVINTTFMEGLKELREADGDRSEKFAEMRKLSEKRNEDLRELLSEEQFAKFEKLQEERRKKMIGRARERRKNN